LNNPHTRQKRNEKKAFDRVKKKPELKWDEFQAQAQQMEQVKRPLLVCLTSEILLDIIGIPTWGVGFIPQSAWACLEKDESLVETIWASRVIYAKPSKLAWGAQNWTLESNKCNRVKEMDVISKYDNSEIIHGQYISIFFFNFKNIVCILTLECNLFFCFFVLGFEAQQRRLLMQMQFDLRLSIVNYLLITMQPKL
jgi:hypothetical protein